MISVPPFCLGCVRRSRHAGGWAMGMEHSSRTIRPPRERDRRRVFTARMAKRIARHARLKNIRWVSIEAATLRLPARLVTRERRARGRPRRAASRGTGRAACAADPARPYRIRQCRHHCPSRAPHPDSSELANPHPWSGRRTAHARRPRTNPPRCRRSRPATCCSRLRRHHSCRCTARPGRGPSS